MNANNAPAYAVQAVLTRAELSYLLQTLGATSLWGGDSRPLFPADATENEAQLAQGLAELKAHEWLRPSSDSRPDRERWEMDRNLVALMAIVADPEIVLVTTRFLPPDDNATLTKEVACHYITSTAIVELIATASGDYQLLTLPSYALLWQRLSEALALPQGVATSDQRYRLDEDSFRRIAQLATSHKLGATRTDPDLADPVLAAVYELLIETQRTAEIEVGRVFGQQLLEGHDFTFLTQPDQVWMLFYESPSTIVIQNTTFSGLEYTLQKYIDALFSLQVG